MKDVLVVGSGPAAAYAVQACKDSGVSVHVISDALPNTSQAGAFFLHWLPDSLLLAGGVAEPVQIIGVGDAGVYAEKQWGRDFRRIATSFPAHGRTEYWYSSCLLQQVWDAQPVEVRAGRPVSDEELLRLGKQYGLVLHTFSSTRAAKSRTLVTIPCLTHPAANLGVGHNRVLYSGMERPKWVRKTVAWKRVSYEYPAWQQRSYEYPGGRVLDAAGLEQAVALTFAQAGVRPHWVRLRDMPPMTAPVREHEYLGRNIIPIGRWAGWRRRMLSHEVYYKVLNLIGGGYATQGTEAQQGGAQANIGSD